MSDRGWRIGITIFITINYLLCWTVWGLAYISKYPPFKARQLDVVALSLVSAFFWQFGGMVNNGLFEHAPPLDGCYFFNQWIYAVLGINACLCLMTYRLLRLYFIAIKRLDASGIYFWSVLLFPYAIGIITAIVPLLTTKELEDFVAILDPETGIRSCHYPSLIYWASCFISPLTIFFQMCFLVFKLRGIKQAFNEFSEMKINVAIGLFLFALDAILYLIAYKSATYSPWQIITFALINAGGSLSLFWCVMFIPLYSYLFKREEDLKQFRRSLKEDKMVDTRQSGGKSSVHSKKRPSVKLP